MAKDCEFCKKTRNKIKSLVPQSLQKTPLQLYEQLRTFQNPFKDQTKKQFMQSTRAKVGRVRND